MAIHLTPTELAREAGLERREVIEKCMELGVPIFQGRIDKTLFLGRGPERIGSIGIVSGSAADSLDEAVAAGLDAFLTGEPREHITAEAAEHRVHFVAAGHHATETFGVRALGELLVDRFGVRHTFFDQENPV